MAIVYFFSFLLLFLSLARAPVFAVTISIGNVPSSVDRTQYFRVGESELTAGTWSEKVRVKPDPDPEDLAYHGPGNYFFKVGRYMSGGMVS